MPSIPGSITSSTTSSGLSLLHGFQNCAIRKALGLKARVCKAYTSISRILASSSTHQIITLYSPCTPVTEKNHPLGNVHRVVAYPFEVFCDHQQVKCVLPVVGVLGYLGDKLAALPAGIFIDDIVLVDDLLRKYCIMFYVSVNAFRDHVIAALAISVRVT